MNKARPKILGSVAASFAMAAMHKKKEKASLSAGPPKPILVQKGGVTLKQREERTLPVPPPPEPIRDILCGTRRCHRQFQSLL